MRAGWTWPLPPLCCSILAVGSQKSFNEHMSVSCTYCPALWSIKHKATCIPEEPFPVFHLCPVVPMGGNGLGSTERREHINFSCIAESMPLNPSPTPYLFQSPHPHLHRIPGGHAAASLFPLSMLGCKYFATSGTAGAITPYH